MIRQILQLNMIRQIPQLNMILFVFSTTTLVEMDTVDPSTIAAPDTSSQEPQYFE